MNIQSYSCFLTVVLVLKNKAETLAETLEQATHIIKPLVQDYEIIIVDNASTDNSLQVLNSLTKVNGLPNLQVYALAKEVDSDTAAWVGVESALGDFVAVIDPEADSIAFLPHMIEQATIGTDVVFALNSIKKVRSLSYKLLFRVFNFFYRVASGVDLADEAPQFRVLNRKVINYILQHPIPNLTYRYLPATGGFSKCHLKYEFIPKNQAHKSLIDSIERGVRLFVSTTKGPMRLVTVLSLFGALSNLMYTFYIVGIALFKKDIAPGWVTLSLQQSGMFFLISLVLLVLGEYILNMSRLVNEGPQYFIAQEFSSATISRRDKLNIETPQTLGLPK